MAGDPMAGDLGYGRRSRLWQEIQAMRGMQEI